MTSPCRYYIEVPQTSTGFSPFELVYDRVVRGPLDIVREQWEATEKSDENVISHVLGIREKIGRMTELVHENLSSAQEAQKVWYDRNARTREFQPDDQVHADSSPDDVTQVDCPVARTLQDRQEGWQGGLPG